MIINNAYALTAILSLVCSIVVFYKGKEKPAVFLLFLAAFFLRLFMAYQDPFLHDWDEKFHALVARNMMNDPFRPVLRINPLVDTDFRSWCCNHIWLHKQPLFMWQMALSMKIFGISEFALRYPSVLMGAIMILLVYRIAKLATANNIIAFVSALFMCVSNYHLELISGYHGMDHNDVAFGFYILASIWAYMEYLHNPDKKLCYALLVGLFAGCAVLTKWLTGLLVFSAWGIHMLLALKDGYAKQELRYIGYALIVCIIVFLPWQLYILHTFPVEARYEYAFNARHLFEVVEGHDGTIWHYWNSFDKYFGKYGIWWLVPAGTLMFAFYPAEKDKYKIALLSCFLFAFVFFSFIVRSKLITYFFCVAPIGYIMGSICMVRILELLKAGKVIQLVAAVVVCYFLLDVAGIKKKRDPNDGYRNAKIHNTIIYKQASTYLPKGIRYVVNLDDMGDVEFMFYNKGITAYHYIPDYILDEIKRRQLPVAIFKDHPPYIVLPPALNYKGTFIIDKELQ